MRFKKPQTGDRRVIKKFAILPVKINNEVRWLEHVEILQVAKDVDYYIYPWHKEKFIDNKERGIL